MTGTWNMVKTTLLMSMPGAVFVGMGAWAGGAGGAEAGLVMGLLAAGGAYWFSDRIALAAAHAKPVSEVEAPELYAIVRDLSGRARMPMPRLYMTPDEQPNAFATGRNEHHAAVAVTLGILEEDELRGVLAHELSHVRNRDILIGSMAAAVAMAVTFIARIAMFGGVYGGGRRDRAGNPLGLLALMILAPLAATLIQMAVSRTRESQADLSGATLIGAGQPLANALRKLDRCSRLVPMDIDPAHATAYVVNPLAGRRISFAALFATHPPMAERIAQLEQFDDSRSSKTHVPGPSSR